MPDTLSAADLDALRTLRRDLHAHPELGFEEERTAGIVAERLRGAGWQVAAGIGETGVVGTLRFGGASEEAPGRIIGLRADMDALAMPETVDAATRPLRLDDARPDARLRA